MELAIDNRSRRALDRHCFEQIVTRSSEAVVLVDPQETSLPVIYVNPAFESLTGYRAEEVVGTPWRLLQRDRDGDPELDQLRGAISRGEAAEVTLPDLRKDGSVCYSRVSFSPVHDARGDVRYLLFLQRAAEQAQEASAEDVCLLRREFARARQKADQTSHMDPITGLLRYEHFVDVLNRDLAVARRDRRPVSLMFFEIVELDVYRGTFGAKAAESCMRMIAAQLSGSLRRAGDLCTRRGESAFVASVLDQEPAEARALAHRIVDNVLGLKLHNPRAASGRYVTAVSAVRGGVPKPDDDAEELVWQLTRALRSEGNAPVAGLTELRGV
jgi:PAS domain S-box-containing protein/diguanylate cyclase (GGDEF)-like protein